MSTRRLVVWITFLAVFAMAARVSIDTDTWWHLRLGETVVQQRSIPKVDSFSYTKLGDKWKYPSSSWLTDVPLYLIYRSFGAGGLNLWVASLATLALAFVYRAMQGGVFLKAFVTILAAATAGVYWAARPYMASFVLTAVALWVLEEYRERRADGLWILPPLMLLWSNSHGGFAVGFILWGVYGLGEGVAWLNDAWQDKSPLSLRLNKDWLRAGLRGRVGRMLLIGALMLVAAAVNPWGPGILSYPFETVSIGALRDLIQEWQSPDFHQIEVQPFLWLLFATLGAVGISEKRLVLVDFLLVAGFATIAFLAARNIALFALVAPVALSRYAAPVAQSLSAQLGFRPMPDKPVSKFQSALNWFLLILLAFAAALKVSLVLPEAENRALYEPGLPVGAVEYLQAEMSEGRLFNSYNWGGYLIWELREYPVFVDGRTDLYGDEIIGEWLQVVGAEDGWQSVLDEWDVNIILLEPHWPVVQELEQEGWTLVYEDEISVVYVSPSITDN